MGFWDEVGKAVGKAASSEYKKLENNMVVYQRERERCRDWDNERLRRMYENARERSIKQAYYEELVERRERGEI